MICTFQYFQNEDSNTNLSWREIYNLRQKLFESSSLVHGIIYHVRISVQKNLEHTSVQQILWSPKIIHLESCYLPFMFYGIELNSFYDYYE